MRVVAYNVHRWRTADDRPNLDLVVRVLEGLNADVIALNEAHHPVRVQGGTALGVLAERLGMRFAYTASDPMKASFASMGSSGDALLTRYPIAHLECGLFASVPGKKQRSFLQAGLDLGGGRIFTVVNLHLDHTDEAARQAQFADLVAWCAQSGSRPDVLLGDFNCIHPREFEGRPRDLADLAAHPVAAHLANAPDGPQLTAQIEAAGYVDALLHRGVLGGGTFVQAETPVRLDYIWLRPELTARLTDASIVGETPGLEASDHRPVLAELDLG